ncbi:unnamed protein product [Adineta steineri]|uniref:Laminin G domain-containing protein n=2 Tax=Adineta steineri TaxID=433720 RepID=A0A818HRA1_9BILA|nr:unnamed protein product [Adineta steineri]CAF3512111.1 unnamed protein product [Adineta steineri]
MDPFDYDNSSSVSRLNSIEGIQFDGRAYALYDSNFKIHDTLTINFQIQTFTQNGLLLWIGDSLPESSFTIEIQNRQLIARAVVRGQPFSVRTNFTKNRLCDGVWHCVQVRLDGSLLSMKVDKRQFTKTEPRINSIDMRGPLFIAGYAENYSPPYLSVRTQNFFHGSIRNLRVNNKQVDWLTPRNSGFAAATPEFHRYSSEATSNNFRPFTSLSAATSGFPRYSPETIINNVRSVPTSSAATSGFPRYSPETTINNVRSVPTSSAATSGFPRYSPETIINNIRSFPSSSTATNQGYETASFATSSTYSGRRKVL